jgi:hypothetical protein
MLDATTVVRDLPTCGAVVGAHGAASKKRAGRGRTERFR